jgi:Cu2+-containing amine oxidase
VRRALCSLAAAALLQLSAGCKVVTPPAQPGPVMCSNSSFASQTFTSASQQTQWSVCFRNLGVQGLGITGATFRPSATAAPVTVLWEGRFADVFVPYHNGDPVFRFHDLQWGYLIPLTPADCPASEGGTLRTLPNETGPRVCQEIRPTGVAWRDTYGVRRGTELVLWGVYDMGNYKMIMEWSFRDDGVLQGRAGATGFNTPTYPWEAHMHNVLWRLDVDVAGSDHDRAALKTHWETTAGLTATDQEQTVTHEAGFMWQAPAFTGMLVEDGVRQNARSHATGYVLVPLRTGTAEHQEPFTQRNLWVTLYNHASAANCGGVPEISWDLPCYANAQPVNDADVILWYMGSIHHHPRDEDGVASEGDPNTTTDNTFTGVTPVMWTGFMLMPHNLFDGPPHWP